MVNIPGCTYLLIAKATLIEIFIIDEKKSLPKGL